MSATRKATSFAVAVIAGGVLAVTAAPLWVACATVAVLSAVLIPWMMLGAETFVRDLSDEREARVRAEELDGRP